MEKRLSNTLNQLLSLPRETATVEFKSNWDYPEDIGNMFLRWQMPPHLNFTTVHGWCGV